MSHDSNSLSLNFAAWVTGEQQKQGTGVTSKFPRNFLENFNLMSPRPSRKAAHWTKEAFWVAFPFGFGEVILGAQFLCIFPQASLDSDYICTALWFWLSHSLLPLECFCFLSFKLVLTPTAWLKELKRRCCQFHVVNKTLLSSFLSFLLSFRISTAWWREPWMLCVVCLVSSPASWGSQYWGKCIAVCCSCAFLSDRSGLPQLTVKEPKLPLCSSEFPVLFSEWVLTPTPWG